MAAILGRHKPDRGVLGYIGAKKRLVGDEGIVLGGNHQHGHTDLRDNFLRAHGFVILLRIAVAKLGARYLILKSAPRSKGPEAVLRIALRKERNLGGVPRHHPRHKTALIKVIV